LLKETFFRFQIQVVLRENIEYLMDDFSVSRQVFFVGLMWERTGMNDAIVHIDGEVPASDMGAEDSVHHRLEGCGGVCQSKEHD